MGSIDNGYECFGGPPEAIKLANGDIVKPGDRVYHKNHGFGTITSFGAAGSSIYNLDVKFDDWIEIHSGRPRAFPGEFNISLWGSQDPLISKVS